MASGVAVGDVVMLTVTELAGYGCWGVANGQTGFIHCFEWSWELPIPVSDQPKVGDQLQVKVIHVVSEAQDQVPLDVTMGGRIRVDFAASVRMLRPRPAPTAPGNATYAP